MNSFFKHTAPALALLGLSLGSCKPDLENSPKSSAGQADFSRYIAVGNSLTAGFGDGGPSSLGGLSLEGQLASYPNILATQFKAVGGGDFNQPLFAANQFNGSGFLKLTGFDGAGNPQISFESSNTANVSGSLVTGTSLLAKYTGPSNQNLGVPGIRVADVTTQGYGLNNPLGFNPYFERMLPNGAAGAVSYLQYVTAQVADIKPTFFTNWLGNNDVLGYATSGGTTTPLTSDAEFTTKYTAVTDALTAGGAKGLLATIPNVVNVPFFTTVPTATVIAGIRAAPVPATTIAGLTAALSLTPTQVATIRFGLFINALTATGTTVAREATANDLLLLTANGVINSPSTTTNPLPRGLGIVITGLTAQQAAGLAVAAPANPLPSNLVLDAIETSNVQSRTTALNTIITNTANSKGLAVFDSNTFFSGVASNGLVVNGVSNTAAFISGNLFSLDGVHPTPRGYAVVANEMIKAINAKYGAAVSGVDPTKYRGARFPQ